MTHGELLDRLQRMRLVETDNEHNPQLNNALRAVVELHKPDEFNHCGVCNQYLCETIQAIEGSLK